LGEPEITPLTEPSLFSLQDDTVGTPLGAAFRAGFFDAGFFDDCCCWAIFAFFCLAASTAARLASAASSFAILASSALACLAAAASSAAARLAAAASSAAARLASAASSAAARLAAAASSAAARLAATASSLAFLTPSAFALVAAAKSGTSFSLGSLGAKAPNKEMVEPDLALFINF